VWSRATLLVEVSVWDIACNLHCGRGGTLAECFFLIARPGRSESLIVDACITEEDVPTGCRDPQDSSRRTGIFSCSWKFRPTSIAAAAVKGGAG